VTWPAGRLESLLTAIAIDGKWLRGVGDGQVKLFAALLHEEKMIIAQHRILDETTGRSYRIPGSRYLRTCRLLCQSFAPVAPRRMPSGESPGAALLASRRGQQAFIRTSGHLGCSAAVEAR
jgi:hypothetical protein